MIVATEYKVVEIDNQGINKAKVFLVADSVPSPLPTNGSGIKGMKSTDVFAPMSILYITADVQNKVYIANTSGVFVAQ